MARVLGSGLGSAELRRALATVDRLGEREIRTTSAIAAGFRDRPVRALAHELGDGMPLARASRSLRSIVEHLGARSRGQHADGELAARLAGSEDEIRDLLGDLDAARAVLDVDNGQLGQQERALWREIQATREIAALAGEIDDRLEEAITALADGEPDRARELRDDVLYVVRRRRRDILLQLAVATQGYAALRRIEQGNLELIWMIRNMSTTTIAALRTATLAARLLAAAGTDSGAGLARIRSAWADVLSALDRVEESRRLTLGTLHEDG